MLAGLLPIGCAIAIAIPAGVMAIMQSVASGKAFLSIARQPRVTGEIRKLLLVSLAFIESLAIYGLLVSLLLLGKIS